MARLACAIYTRKSSEEGLEQDFNSLDAQREACSAFIASQKHEGWVALKETYDDGGWSGGTMDRPALNRLLADIRAGRVNIVVVYKVDRLTRSLSDFARIVETFDGHKVSFVSVTQQFNTTSSMGRLTLNVLLSFAQFEREVTGERIRDKIAASKAKGMWMGGVVPLGYDLRERRLFINPAEAELVRALYQRYLEAGDVGRLAEWADRQGFRSKARMRADGTAYGACQFTRGALRTILRNRLYLGEVVHKGRTYEGQHEAIVDRTLWDDVHALSQRRQVKHRAHQAGYPALLRDRIVDQAGNRLKPVWGVSRGRRYGYYENEGADAHKAAASDPRIVHRVRADKLEALALQALMIFLTSPVEIAKAARSSRVSAGQVPGLITAAQTLADQLPSLSVAQQVAVFSRVVAQARLGDGVLELDIMLQNLLPDGEDRPSAPYCLSHAVQFKRTRTEMQLLVGGLDDPQEPNEALVKAVLRARTYCQAHIQEGQTLETIAAAHNVTDGYVGRIIRLGFLSPQVMSAILDGRQNPALTVGDLLNDVPLDWTEQRRRYLRA